MQTSNNVRLIVQQYVVFVLCFILIAVNKKSLIFYDNWFQEFSIKIFLMFQVVDLAIKADDKNQEDESEVY